MAVAFNSIPFAVLTDGELPYPTQDESGVNYYTCEARVLSLANLKSLKSRVSRVTVRPAMGSVGGGIAVVEAGVGAKTLTIPLPSGDEESWSAILTMVEPRGRLNNDTAWFVTLTFLALSES